MPSLTRSSTLPFASIRSALPFPAAGSWAASILLGFTVSSVASAQASWHSLGHLPGGSIWSRAYGVNVDGSVVSGQVNTHAGSEPSRWTVSGGHEALGGPSAFSGILGSGWRVSENGEVVLGSYLTTSTSSPGLPGFRWTRDTGVTLIRPLHPEDGSTAAQAASADGEVLVGASGSVFGSTGSTPPPPPTLKAYRWEVTTGLVSLGFLPGGIYSRAIGVSGDGSVVVGWSDTGPRIEAYRWTASTGMVGLGVLPSAADSRASDVSSDGLVVVGSSGDDAFRWTAATGMQSLGAGSAIAVNADGSVILGEDWLWTPAMGRTPLFAHLASLGAMLPSAGALTARDLSADGNAIVGEWVEAHTLGWIAYLSTPAFDLCSLREDDPFEPNNDCAEAASIATGMHGQLNVQGNDPDFYSVLVDVGSTLSVTAAFEHARADVDLYLHPDSGCGTTGPLASSISSTDDEMLQWQNLTGLPIVVVLEIRIAPDSIGHCNEYDLIVDPDPGLRIGVNYCGPAVLSSSGLPAILQATGGESAASNDVTLTAYQLPQSVTGYFLASMSQAFVAHPGGSFGNLCLGAPIGRFDASVQSAGSAGQFAQSIDLTAIPFPAGTRSVQVGETWNFQCWFRDSLSGVSGSNFTDAVSITFF